MVRSSRGDDHNEETPLEPTPYHTVLLTEARPSEKGRVDLPPSPGAAKKPKPPVAPRKKSLGEQQRKRRGGSRLGSLQDRGNGDASTLGPKVGGATSAGEADYLKVVL